MASREPPSNGGGSGGGRRFPLTSSSATSLEEEGSCDSQAASSSKASTSSRTVGERVFPERTGGPASVNMGGPTTQPRTDTDSKRDTVSSAPTTMRRALHGSNRGQRARGLLFGAGFRSGPPRSKDSNADSQPSEQKVSRYREVSDSEWDAIDASQKAQQNNVVVGTRQEDTQRRRQSANARQDRSYVANKQRLEDRPSRAFMPKKTSSGLSRGRRAAEKAEFADVCRALIDSGDEKSGDALQSDAADVRQPDQSVIQRLEECCLTVRPGSASSKLIDEFVTADLDAGMESTEVRRRGDPIYVDDLSHNNIRKFLEKNTLSSGALSVLLDLFQFPPTLRTRPPNTLLRKVIIDGCAVSGCYDREYSVSWGRIKDTSKLSWTPCKVLSMRPIYQCLVVFLLRGHKVTILLPVYYMDVSPNGLRCKVDDVEAFNVLMNLNLIEFVGKCAGRTPMEDMREQVDKVDALFVSAGFYDMKDAWEYTPTSTFGMTEAERNATLPTAFTQASRRMVTPIFFGRAQHMTIVFSYQTKSDGAWMTVPEDVLCCYAPNTDSDRNIDDAGRLCQQLLFEDQIKLLVAVKDLFEWSTILRRGISALLRLNFLVTSLA